MSGAKESETSKKATEKVEEKTAEKANKAPEKKSGGSTREPCDSCKRAGTLDECRKSTGTACLRCYRLKARCSWAGGRNAPRKKAKVEVVVPSTKGKSSGLHRMGSGLIARSSYQAGADFRGEGQL